MERNPEQSYYEHLSATDIVGLVEVLIRRGSYRFREADGKLAPELMIGHTSPWHHVKHIKGYDCETWHRVLFDVIGDKMGLKFVPSRCQECWKVVVRPPTVRGLFQLLDLQIRLNVPSKCGIEVRETVNGLYGGYFYNRNIVEGVHRYRQVREEVNKNLDGGDKIPVILKRACTEFELAVGNSYYWDIPDWQLLLEEELDNVLGKDDIDRVQPEPVLRHIHKRWIEWAYQNGDSTYALYTGGKSLYPVPHTYHEELKEASDAEIVEFYRKMKSDVIERRNGHHPDSITEEEIKDKVRAPRKPRKDKMVKGPEVQK